MRPGRFDHVIYVAPPNEEERHQILLIHTESIKLESDVDLVYISKNDVSSNYTGADIEAAVREACLFALRESMDCDSVVRIHIFKFKTKRQCVILCLLFKSLDQL